MKSKFLSSPLLARDLEALVSICEMGIFTTKTLGAHSVDSVLSLHDFIESTMLSCELGPKLLYFTLGT